MARPATIDSTACWVRTTTRVELKPAGSTTRATARCSPIVACAAPLSLPCVPPGADVRYCIASYSSPVPADLAQMRRCPRACRSPMGRPLGGTIGMPPYKRFFAGGPDTVRGYPEDTLGPVDTNGNPYGGNMLTVSRTELLVPMPAKWQTSARGSLFFDMGNVFSTDGTNMSARTWRPPSTYKFSYQSLRPRPVSRCSGWRRRWAFSASATAYRSTRFRAIRSIFQTAPRASNSPSGSPFSVT